MDVTGRPREVMNNLKRCNLASEDPVCKCYHEKKGVYPASKIVSCLHFSSRKRLRQTYPGSSFCVNGNITDICSKGLRGGRDLPVQQAKIYITLMSDPEIMSNRPRMVNDQTTDCLRHPQVADIRPDRHTNGR
jgi:hypothetical protein